MIFFYSNLNVNLDLDLNQTTVDWTEFSYECNFCANYIPCHFFRKKDKILRVVNRTNRKLKMLSFGRSSVRNIDFEHSNGQAMSDD